MILLNKNKLLKFKELDCLEIVAKWERIGILEGLRNKDKTQLALYLEELLNYLIQIGSLSNRYNQFETLVFPVLRRIYERNIGKKIKVRELAIDFRLFVESSHFEREMQRFQHDPNIDIEAKLVADYASKYRL